MRTVHDPDPPGPDACPVPPYVLNQPQERMDGRVQEGDSLQQDDGINGNRTTRPKSLEKQQKQQQKKKQQAWSWRYVNVEKKALLVWDRRGGRLMRSIPLKNVESLSVLPDKVCHGKGHFTGISIQNCIHKFAALPDLMARCFARRVLLCLSSNYAI